MNDPHGNEQERYRTPPAVWLAIIAGLCLIGGVVLVRSGENEHNRQVRDNVDQFVDAFGG